MKSRLLILSGILFIIVRGISCGQVNELDSEIISDKFNQYCNNYQFDDLYIHSDREVYTAGESILMKAYLFDRGSMTLTSRSSYAYAELINPLNIPVGRIKIFLENGSGSSVMQIPDTLLNGLYTLRAYTNLMKNYMPYGCFRKSIMIVNPFSNTFVNFASGRRGIKEKPFKMNFFPEGGKMISGLPSRIGIHVYDKFGNPSSFHGFLKDEAGNTVKTILIDSTGLGLLEFTPEKGKSYIAEYGNGEPDFLLPDVSDSGLSLFVTGGSSENVDISVCQNESNYPGKSSKITVIIRALGKILFTSIEYLTGEKTKVSVPVRKLATGINNIVIFNESGDPVNERFIYIPDTAVLRVNFQGKTEYNTREKIFIDPGTELSMDSGQFSISVSVPFPGIYSPSIKDYLVFGAEYMIENHPGDIADSFFKSGPDKKDILLLGLTSNWINWKEIIAGSQAQPLFMAETIGQYISLIRAREGNSENDWYKPAIMTMPGKIPQFQYALPDRNMMYTFIVENGPREKDIVINMPDTGSSNIFIMRETFSEEHLWQPFMADTGKPSNIAYNVEMISRNYQVMKMYNSRNILPGGNDTAGMYSLSRFYGKPDREIIMNDYIGLPAMREVFLELVPGITVRRNKGIATFHIIEPVSNTAFEEQPGMFVDGVMIYDPEVILNMNPEHVEKIDIITSEYIVGDIVFKGIINVITRKGDFSNIALPDNAIRIRYKLYDPSADFIAPDYSDQKEKISRVPDFRNTLYWNDNVDLPGEHQHAVSFWASDYTSEYVVKIQGVDSSGQPFSLRRIISVK